MPLVLLRSDLPNIISAIQSLAQALENPRQWATANMEALPPDHSLKLPGVLDDNYLTFQEAVAHCRQKLRGLLTPNGEQDEWGNIPSIAESQLELKQKAKLKELLRLLMRNGPLDFWMTREEKLTYLECLQLELAGSAGAAPQAGKTEQGEGEKAGADPFADLRRFARAELKGQERAVIEALCDAAGELPIADLALKEGVGWTDPFQGFKDVQRRLGKKLKGQRWQMNRQANAARLVSM